MKLIFENSPNCALSEIVKFCLYRRTNDSSELLTDSDVNTEGAFDSDRQTNVFFQWTIPLGMKMFELGNDSLYIKIYVQRNIARK